MIEKYFRLKRENIAPVQFIVEGYEGMATVSTIDSRKAIIKISIMPGYISDISSVIDELKNIYLIEQIYNYKEEISLC